MSDYDTDIVSWSERQASLLRQYAIVARANGDRLAQHHRGNRERGPIEALGADKQYSIHHRTSCQAGSVTSA